MIVYITDTWFPCCHDSPQTAPRVGQYRRWATEHDRRVRGATKTKRETQILQLSLPTLSPTSRDRQYCTAPVTTAQRNCGGKYNDLLSLAVIIPNIFVLQIFYYSTDLFKAAGLSNGDIATVAVGVVLVIFTLITVSTRTLHPHTAHTLTSSQVFLIEVVGRRTLMLYGLGGMAICFAFLTSMFCFKVYVPQLIATL